MKRKQVAIFIFLMILFSCDEKESVMPNPTPKNTEVGGVINDEISGVSIVVYGSKEHQFFSAFRRIDELGNEYTFEASSLPFPDVFRDQNGDVWSAFGFKSKDNSNLKLRSLKYLVGYWFVFPPFHEKIVLMDGSEIENPNFARKQTSDWLVDAQFVFAGSIKDGIQSIDNPEFISVTSKDFLENDFYNTLENDELITVVRYGKEVHLYPHRILEYHEIVNDKFADTKVTVSYCPLTGTSKAWIAEGECENTEFGVSGLLYNNNLILYDRVTDSNWSQILNLSINGQKSGLQIRELEVWEIKVEDILSINANIKLLTTNTGIEYEYRFPVYGNYRYEDRISFPLTFSNESISPKERVLGITENGLTKVYRFDDF